MPIIIGTVSGLSNIIMSLMMGSLRSNRSPLKSSSDYALDRRLGETFLLSFMLFWLFGAS